MSKSAKKKLYITLAVLVILIIINVIYTFATKYKNVSTTEKVKIIEQVQDYNTFYTIENCINNYVTCNYNGNYEATYMMLDKEYKHKYYKNLKNYTKKVSENTYKDNMFLLKNIYKVDNRYFCSGNIGYKGVEIFVKRAEVSYLIELYDNNTFSIIPNTKLMYGDQELTDVSNENIKLVY